MKFRGKIYNLLINQQDIILELLTHMDVTNPKEKIKSFLDVELFEVLESSDTEITKIKNKVTGDILEKGCNVYSTKYNKWVECIRFGEDLFGIQYFKKYFKNYVRASNHGMYHLTEISLSDKPVIIEPNQFCEHLGKILEEQKQN